MEVQLRSLFLNDLQQIEEIKQFPPVRETTFEDLISRVEELFANRLYQENLVKTGPIELAVKLLNPEDPICVNLRERLFFEFERAIKEEKGTQERAPESWISMSSLKGLFSAKEPYPSVPQQEAVKIIADGKFLVRLPKLKSFQEAVEKLQVACKIWEETLREAPEIIEWLTKFSKEQFEQFSLDQDQLLDAITMKPLTEDAVMFLPEVRDSAVNPSTAKEIISKLNCNPFTNLPYEGIDPDFNAQLSVLFEENRLLSQISQETLKGSKECKMDAQQIALGLFLVYLKNCSKGKTRLMDCLRSMNKFNDINEIYEKSFENAYAENPSSSVFDLKSKACKKIEDINDCIKDIKTSLVQEFSSFVDQQVLREQEGVKYVGKYIEREGAKDIKRYLK